MRGYIERWKRGDVTFTEIAVTQIIGAVIGLALGSLLILFRLLPWL